MAADQPDRALDRGAPIPRAWSFPESSTAELSHRLTAAGPGATLTVRPYTRDGLMYLNLRVVGAELSALDDEPDINDSRPCPPFSNCGGG